MGRAASKSILAALLGAVCAAVVVAGGSASARDGMVDPVSEKVQVESRNGKVLVRFTVDNQSDRTVWVARSVATAQELFGNWFEVRDSSNGDPLDYLGPTVKRAPLGKADFVAVKAHSQLKNTIDITRAYAFMQGRHTYQLNYAGTYLADVRKIADATSVEPDSAMFAHVVK